jgi:DNA-binding phage protein
MPRTARRPATHDPAAIRARLRALADASGLRPSQIAAAAGHEPGQLWHLLTGLKGEPRISTVGRILAAMGLPWSALDGAGPP